MSKRDSIVFFISELKYEGLGRKDVITEVMSEYDISKTNAAYYYDRVVK